MTARIDALRVQKAQALLRNPAALGRALGYTGLRDEIHGRWLREFLRPAGDFTLQANRGSYKTTCLALAIPIRMIRYRDENIIFLRKTDADVAEVIKQVGRVLASPLFQEIYTVLTGDTLQIVKANVSEITTSAYTAPRGAAQLLGIGIGGSITGKHADVIFTDDIVNRLDRVSRAERERTKAAYQELQNIRNPGGRIINTGTPWHPEDAFSLMPAPEKWDVYQTGILTPEQIAALNASMAPSLFAANYELRHIAAEGALFPETPPTAADVTPIFDGIAHVDAAYGGDDYTALTCARRAGDTLYLYGRLWQAHVDTVLDVIQADTARLRCGPVYCETNGDKGYLGRELRARGMAPRMYAEKENKYMKISTYLRKWWKNVVFIPGTDPAYIQQIATYTEDAQHDDAPDSAACAARILDRAPAEAVDFFLTR